MKPPKFALYRPKSLDQVVEVIHSMGGAAALLAGGQSLIPMLNFRIASPEVLVDLAGIPELDIIEIRDGSLFIGAMTRQRVAEQDPLVVRYAPLFVDALRWVGHATTRTRGTIGGSISLADPSAELPLALLVMDGCVHAMGKNGQRVIDADKFFTGSYSTSLKQDEIVIGISVPIVENLEGFSVEEFSRRRGDFATAGVASLIQLNSDKKRVLRIGLCGVAGRPLRLFSAEKVFAENSGPIEKQIQFASEVAIDDIDTAMFLESEDERYMQRLIRELTSRSLHRAFGVGTRSSGDY